MSCAFDMTASAAPSAVAPSEWFTLAELAALALPGLPRTKRGLLDVARREAWDIRQDDDGAPLSRPRRARGGGIEYHLTVLPDAAKVKLLGRSKPRAAAAVADNRESAWARYDRLPASMKATAKERLEIIQRVEQLMRAGLGKAKACETVTAQALREARARGEAKGPFGLTSLNDWFSRIAGVDSADRLAYLAPNYVGRTAVAECSEEAWLLFRSEYLTNSRQSAEAAHAKAVAMGEERCWTVPSCKTLLARVRREIDPVTLVYLREGEPGLERRFPTPRRSVADLDILHAVNVDGHELDIMVEWADGTISRPMMIAIQDVYSRRMLVTQIGRSESTDLIRRAFAKLFSIHGIPQVVTFDNGRAFASKWLTGGNPTRYRFVIRPEDPIGLLGQLGCHVHFTNPFSGRSKPIERGFRDFADGFARSAVFAGAYTGNRVTNKPADYGTRAAPYADFEQELAFYTKLHNGRVGRRTETARGQLSFDGVWAERLEAGALIKRATPEQLRLALLAVEGVTVRRQTAQLHLANNVYFNEALWRFEGQKVIVRFEPEDLHQPLHVYSLDGVYLCAAECIEAQGFYNAEAAKEVSRKQRKVLKAAKRLAEEQRLLSAAQVAAYRPDLSDPEFAEDDRVIAPVFGALALQMRPAPQPAADEISEAEVIEFHARAMERLAAAQE
ncbi:MAG: hypothetical protein DCF29_07990 [Alphaproteobacteria bacterium]|nr:MAG: hypothetical protein DCF29_07990 [Alphaproteobacteria bacterium]